MAQTKLNMTLLLRRDDFTTEANRGYILQEGEPGYCKVEKVFKVGDGTTTWAELDFANQAEIEALIKVVDDKVAALGDTYATDEEVRVIKEALEASIKTINDKLATYGDIVTHNAADFDEAGAAAAVASDLADYETSNDTRVKAIEDELDTFGDIVTHDAADFATAAQGAKADAAAVKADVDAAFEATNNEVAAVRVIAEAARTETEVDSQIDAKIATLNLAGTYEPIGAEDRAKSYVDGKFTDANLDQYTTEEEVKDIVDKVITDAVEGDTLTSLTDLVEYLSTHGGEYAELAATVEDHENRIDALEAVPASTITATQISNWDGEVGAKALAQGVKDVVDGNKATWDLAGTAVQSSAFETFKTENTAAINAAQKAGEDAAAAVAKDLGEYEESNDARVKDVEDAIAALDDTFATDEELADAVETINGEIAKKLDANGWSTADGNLTKTFDDGSIAGISTWLSNGAVIAVASPDGSKQSMILKEGLMITESDNGTDIIAAYTHSGISAGTIDAPTSLLFPEKSGTFALTDDVATAKQEAIDAAKEYANGLDHEDTTYTFAPTANALEFTVTPDGKGEGQTITLVAPTVNTGIMSVEAGNDIAVTPGENGKVTVAHETFTTGTYEKNPESSDKTGDVYMMTAVTVDNGHVTGANVQSLAHALEAMEFILDGGNAQG